MKMAIEATGQITHPNGVECRVWEGVTEEGVPCKVFVHLIATLRMDDNTQFERELEEKLPPAHVVDLRTVLP